MDKAVFAGSFDPFTLGHLDLVQRAAPWFSELIVLVACNPDKKGLLTLNERVEVASLSVQGIPNVHVDSWSGLVVEYLRQANATKLLRGLRNPLDLSWEQSIAWNNAKLNPSCETIFLMAAQEHLHISSSLVRDLLRHGADISGLVPSPVQPLLRRKCSD
ncbi:MAG TPA: pantetheine-phosphate adenylyltransferase [Fibrobacteraceae bacterium]|nr:pantetheine-phosphate adenylyltransferase [Fibrobacteraceae bacterium]